MGITKSDSGTKNLQLVYSLLYFQSAAFKCHAKNRMWKYISNSLLFVRSSPLVGRNSRYLRTKPEYLQRRGSSWTLATAYWSKTFKIKKKHDALADGGTDFK